MKIKAQYQILSIDAWKDQEGWQWNNWFRSGTIEEIPKTNRGILKMMRDEGYLADGSKGKLAIEDDEYNLVIVEKNTREPLFAIEYKYKEIEDSYD
jgi:hypothetical protein